MSPGQRVSFGGDRRWGRWEAREGGVGKENGPASIRWARRSLLAWIWKGLDGIRSLGVMPRIGSSDMVPKCSLAEGQIRWKVWVRINGSNIA